MLQNETRKDRYVSNIYHNEAGQPGFSCRLEYRCGECAGPLPVLKTGKPIDPLADANIILIDIYGLCPKHPKGGFFVVWMIDDCRYPL